MKHRAAAAAAVLLCAAALAFLASQNRAEEWRGLVVSPESRCSPYDKDDYPYRSSVEEKIVAGMGGRIYGPYTGRTFGSMRQTDIEHIVARSEAHDSGLCAASPETRRAFAGDLLNLTLAAPEINQCEPGGKCAKDVAEWLPERNSCWFVARTIEVRRKYRLTIDRREASAADAVLRNCASTDMWFAPASAAPQASPAPEPQGDRSATPSGRRDDGRGGI